MEGIIKAIEKHIEVKKKILNDKVLINSIKRSADVIIKTFGQDKKVLLCGNGGSVADAQHIAAELSWNFYFDRDPLFVEALNVNISYLIAVSNDYSYDKVYCRLVKANGRKGDILIGISTSGNSNNIIKAIEMGNSIGMATIGLTGNDGGKMKKIMRFINKYSIKVNSTHSRSPHFDRTYYM